MEDVRTARAHVTVNQSGNVTELRHSLFVTFPLQLFFVTLAAVIFLTATLWQIDRPGIYYDEAYWAPVALRIVDAQAPIGASAEISLGGRSWPVMLAPYIGALKSYLLAPGFALFGPSAVTLRVPSILLGLCVLIGAYWLVRQWFTSVAAVIGILLLSTDPMFITYFRHDHGPVSLATAATIFAPLAGMVWWRTGNRKWLVVSGLAAGLGVFDKWLYLSILIPGAMAFLLLQPRLARRFLNKQNLPFWISGATLGAAPLLWWILFRFQELRGALTSTTGENAILVNLARQIQIMADLFLGMYRVNTAVLGGMFPIALERLSAWPLLLAIVIAAMINTLRLRRSLFHHVTRGMLVIPLWICLSLFFWTLVPDGGKPHHLLPLYVLAVLWTASIIGKVTLEWRWPIVAVAILLCITANLVTIGRFHSQLAVESGHNRWSMVTAELAQVVKQSPRKQFIFLDWGLLNPVYTLANGPSNTREFVWPVVLKNPNAESQIEALLADPETVFVNYGPNYTMFDQPRDAISAAASSANVTLDCHPFSVDSTFEPLVELCAVQK